MYEISIPEEAYMSVQEFREAGYLQEVNRRFLNPLGLVMVTEQDEVTGEEIIKGVADFRTSAEGIAIGLATAPKEALIEFRNKASRISRELENKKGPRIHTLGSQVEPIPREEV